MSRKTTSDPAFSGLWEQLSRSDLLPDRSLVLYLLFLRLLSGAYRPSCYQLSLEDLCRGESSEQSKETPWGILAENADEDYCISLRRATAAAEAAFPVLRNHLPSVEILPEVSSAQMTQMVEILSDLRVLSRPQGAYSALGFAEFLKRFAAEQPHGHGDDSMPDDVVHFMCGILAPISGRIYDPCCKSGSLILGVAENDNNEQLLDFSVQIENTEEAAVCRMNFFLNLRAADFGGKNVSALTEDLYQGKCFNRILASPAFNQAKWCEKVQEEDPRWEFGVPPRSNANFAWLQHVAHHLEESGRAAVLLANGSLTTQVSAERTIRDAMVHSGLVEAVIALPPGLFYSTKVPCCVWLLAKERNPHRRILLVDAKSSGQKVAAQNKKNKVIPEDFLNELCGLLCRMRDGTLEGTTETYAVVSPEEIAAHGGTLSPTDYTLQPKATPKKQKTPSVLPALSRELQALLEKEEQINEQLKRQLEAMGLAM